MVSLWVGCLTLFCYMTTHFILTRDLDLIKYQFGSSLFQKCSSFILVQRFSKIQGWFLFRSSHWIIKQTEKKCWHGFFATDVLLCSGLISSEVPSNVESKLIWSLEMVQFSASNLKSDISQLDTASHERNRVGERGKIHCFSPASSVKTNPSESGKIASCCTSGTREGLIVTFLSPTVSLLWQRGDVPSVPFA